jgi:hypothetical protein
MTLSESIQFTKWALRREGITFFTRVTTEEIIPSTIRFSEGLTSFPQCYPTLMKVR